MRLHDPQSEQRLFPYTALHTITNRIRH